MTTSTSQSRGHFLSLRSSCFAAMDEANSRFRAARRTGDEAETARYFALFNQLSDELDNIRAAEVVFRSSPLNDSDADVRLRQVVGEAKGAVRRMKRIGESLNGLADAINVFGRLAALF